MVREIIQQWDANRSILEKWLRDTPQSEYDEYEKIVKALFTHVIKGYNAKKMVVVDHGEYQGTQLFIIPKKTYQPSVDDYLITHNDYGSCSGCDTLQSICTYTEGPPNEQQVKEYMLLALHLVQRMQRLKD